jgi:hypothetical protein
MELGRLDEERKLELLLDNHFQALLDWMDPNLPYENRSQEEYIAFFEEALEMMGALAQYQ